MNKNRTDNILKVLSWITKSCLHPIQYFRDGCLLASTVGESLSVGVSLENVFLCDTDLFNKLTSFDKKSNQLSEALWSYLRTEKNDPDICYGILEMEPNECILIGPVALHKLSPIQLREYIKTHHIGDYKNYFIRKGTVSQITATLCLISYTLYGKTTDPKLFLKKKTSDTEPTALQKYQLDNSELDIQHLPYKIEDYIMSCIRNGTPDTFELILDNYESYSFGKMSESSQKQEEYSAVIGISLMARAAIEGGVDPYCVYDINDLYLQQISQAKTSSDYQRISSRASRDFIEAVRKSKTLQSQSVHTEKCKQYIARHLNAHFTLEELSATVGLNRTYLSGIFRQYEGMTLTEYIHRERINAACNMLRFSDYSLAQIAEYFCFHSQSHFGKVFKKYTSSTPQQYRLKYGHESIGNW